MARYYWDVESIRRDLTKLRKAAEREKDLERKAILDYQYDVANHDVYLSYTSPDVKRVSKSDSMITKYGNFLGEQRFFYLVEAFNGPFEKNLKLYNETANNKEKLTKEIEKATRVHVGREQAISICLGFYQNLDDELYDALLPFYKTRFNHMRFTNEIKAKGTNLTRGNQFFLYGINSNYVNILATDNPVMTFSMLHEFGHVIDNAMNPDASLYEDYMYEVVTLFMELVSLYEKVGDYGDLFYSGFLMQRITTFFGYADDAVEYDILMGHYKHNDYVLDDGFYKMAKEEDGFTKKCANQILFDEDISNMVYPIDVSLALYFFNIYKQDKKRGLEELKKFINTTDRSVYYPLMYSKDFLKIVTKELGTVMANANNTFKKELAMVKKV